MESEWKLKLTPLARTDLEEIYQYISICLDAPQAADRLMTAFEKALNSFKTIRSVSRVQMMKACGKRIPKIDR